MSHSLAIVVSKRDIYQLIDDASVRVMPSTPKKVMKQSKRISFSGEFSVTWRLLRKHINQQYTYSVM